MSRSVQLQSSELGRVVTISEGLRDLRLPFAHLPELSTFRLWRKVPWPTQPNNLSTWTFIWLSVLQRERTYSPKTGACIGCAWWRGWSEGIDTVECGSGAGGNGEEQVARDNMGNLDNLLDVSHPGVPSRV